MRFLLVDGPAHGGIYEHREMPLHTPQVTHHEGLAEHLYDRWVHSAPAPDGAYDAVFVHSAVRSDLVDRRCQAAVSEREKLV